MARLNSANNAESTLATGITPTDTQISVTDASVFPNAPFRATINGEIIEVGSINRSTNTFSSVLRAREDTVASSHSAGSPVQNRFTAGTHMELADQAEVTTTNNNLNSHIGNKSNPHGVTAAQVGAYTKAESDTKLKDYKHFQASLWSGATFMNAVTTIYPTKKLTECRNGWAFLFSDYNIGEGARDLDYFWYFVPRGLTTYGQGHHQVLIPTYWSPTTTEFFVTKTLYIYDDRVTGHENNSLPGNQQDACLRRIIEY